MQVVAAPPEDFPWIVDRTQCALTPGARAIKAVDQTGAIQGMVLYDGWTQNACTAHMATDTPLAWRYLLAPAFAYPFLEAGKGLILATIPAHNHRSVQLARHFGFEDVARIHDGWAPGDDLFLLEMRRERCRYIAGVRKVA